MFTLEIAGVPQKCAVEIDASISVRELKKTVGATGLSEDQYYIVQNGRLLYDDDVIRSRNSHVAIVPRLFGGKGGFGSMLRAIGAQIEKTTNREACRDLSGRRLRDINKEKRLKAWIENKSKREEEAVERKKRKLEKLCAEVKHEFDYNRYREESDRIADRVTEAIEEGRKVAAVEKEQKGKVKPTIRRTLIDPDIDSDELDSSDSSDDEVASAKVSQKEPERSNDSGCSADGGSTSGETTEKIVGECSNSSSDTQKSEEVSHSDTADTKSVDSVKCADDQTEDSPKEAIAKE